MVRALARIQLQSHGTIYLLCGPVDFKFGPLDCVHYNRDFIITRACYMHVG